MTTLLQRALAEVEKLPAEDQDAIGCQHFVEGRAMNPRHSALPLLLVALTGCAGANGQQKRTDLDRLQGTWQAKTGANGDTTALLKVEGKRAVAQLRKDGRELATIQGEIKLDETAVPKTFDFIEDGQAKPTYLAIYRMDGDSFTICSGTPDIGRPSRFKEGPEGWPALKVYRRVSE